MACEVFKIVNNISPSFIQNLIIIKCSQYSLRKDNTAVVPKANTAKYGLKSFAHDGPRIWNSLPNEMRKTTASFADLSGTGMAHHAIALYVGKQLTANMFVTMPIL